MEELFNHWAKIRINDTEVRKLIEIAMSPSKEIFNSLKKDARDSLSTQYVNIVNNVVEFAFDAQSQQLDTTRGTLFGAYNAVTGYFQNVRCFASEEAKFKSITNGTALQRAQVAFNCCSEFAKQGIICYN